jgi:hypothetical protein
MSHVAAGHGVISNLSIPENIHDPQVEITRDLYGKVEHT